MSYWAMRMYAISVEDKSVGHRKRGSRKPATRVGTYYQILIIMKRFILPVSAILLATGSAFATQNAKINKSKLVDRQAYIYNFSTNQCDRIEPLCSTDPGPICTVNGMEGSQQAFGTSGADEEHPLTCDVTLSRKLN